MRSAQSAIKYSSPSQPPLGVVDVRKDCRYCSLALSKGIYSSPKTTSEFITPFSEFITPLLRKVGTGTRDLQPDLPYGDELPSKTDASVVPSLRWIVEEDQVWSLHRAALNTLVLASSCDCCCLGQLLKGCFV